MCLGVICFLLFAYCGVSVHTIKMLVHKFPLDSAIRELWSKCVGLVCGDGEDRQRVF